MAKYNHLEFLAPVYILPKSAHTWRVGDSLPTDPAPGKFDPTGLPRSPHETLCLLT